MEHTYKYTILTAVPDPRRGERVNVGIVIFKDGGLDVRFRQASAKLKALTGATWESRIQSVEKLIKGAYDKDAPAEDVLRRIELIDPIIVPVGFGEINTTGGADFEARIDEILSSLVLPPRQLRAKGQSRINTEIANIFRKHKVLADSNESISKKKIVRDLPIAPSEGLRADFALQNGRLHVASTLDLRKANTSLAEAALKSITLDKAHDVYEKKRQKIRTIGVYAVPSDMRAHFKQHIELLGDYADEIYNWEDRRQHEKFLKTMYDAMPAEFFGTKRYPPKRRSKAAA